MSEKGVTMGRMLFLSPVFVGMTGNCGCGSRFFYTFNDEVKWIYASQ